ncbi:MAG: hypothetical protein ACLUD4_09115, partial [Thomasclavelia spiroformis]
YIGIATDIIQEQANLYKQIIQPATKSIEIIQKAMMPFNIIYVEKIIAALSPASEITKAVRDSISFYNLESMQYVFNSTDILNKYSDTLFITMNSFDTAFKSINYTTMTASDFNKIYDTMPKVIENFIEENPKVLDDVFEFYKDNKKNNRNEIKEAITQKENIDWKFIIGSIIVPVILSLIGQMIEKPAIEIHNEYNMEINGSTQASDDIEEIIRFLEEFQNNSQQSDGIGNNSK